jgi:hypothetical protein
MPGTFDFKLQQFNEQVVLPKLQPDLQNKTANTQNFQNK